MFLRGLIPRNCMELAEAVLIGPPDNSFKEGGGGPVNYFFIMKNVVFKVF